MKSAPVFEKDMGLSLSEPHAAVHVIAGKGREPGDVADLLHAMAGFNKGLYEDVAMKPTQPVQIKGNKFDGHALHSLVLDS